MDDIDFREFLKTLICPFLRCFFLVLMFAELACGTHCYLMVKGGVGDCYCHSNWANHDSNNIDYAANLQVQRLDTSVDQKLVQESSPFLGAFWPRYTISLDNNSSVPAFPTSSVTPLLLCRFLGSNLTCTKIVFAASVKSLSPKPLS